MKRAIGFFIAFFFLQVFLVLPATVYADGCSATISPTTGTTGSNSFHVAVSNSTDQISWVQITAPTSGYAITGASSSFETNSLRAEWVILVGDPVATGDTVGFDITADISASPGDSGTWRVDASADSNGAGSSSCGGSLTTSIQEAFSQSAISVGTITTSTAVLTWTTSYPATSVMEYGTTTTYGLTLSDTTASTAHSTTLSGLSAGTVYNYKVKSTRGSGEVVQSSNSSLVTAQNSGPTATPVIVVVKEIVKTPNNTPTPTQKPTATPVKTSASVKVVATEAPDLAVLGESTSSASPTPVGRLGFMARVLQDKVTAVRYFAMSLAGASVLGAIGYWIYTIKGLRVNIKVKTKKYKR